MEGKMRRIQLLYYTLNNLSISSLHLHHYNKCKSYCYQSISCSSLVQSQIQTSIEYSGKVHLGANSTYAVAHLLAHSPVRHPQLLSPSYYYQKIQFCQLSVFFAAANNYASIRACQICMLLSSVVVCSPLASVLQSQLRTRGDNSATRSHPVHSCRQHLQRYRQTSVSRGSGLRRFLSHFRYQIR